VDAFEALIPLETQVRSSVEINNVWKDSQAEEHNGLFMVELVEDLANARFAYNIIPADIVEVVCEVFRDGVKILGDIEQVERKLLKDLFKTSAHLSKLKVP